MDPRYVPDRWKTSFVLFALAGSAAACKAKVGGAASVDVEEGAKVRVDARAEARAEGTAPKTSQVVQFRLEQNELTYEGEVRFATDSAELVGSGTFAILDALARFLEEHPQVKIRVEGHTDSRGSDSYNQRLSEERAHAVVEYLVQKGIARDRMTHAGLGESQPAQPEPPECEDRSTEEAPVECEQYWKRNRRTEFHVTEGRETIAVPEPRRAPRPAVRDEPVDLAEGWFPGVYVYLAPGIVAVPIGPERTYRWASYQWGAGVGYLFAPGRRFRLGLGLGLEHAPMRVAGVDNCQAPGGGLSDRCDPMHDLRLTAELRLGGAGERAFGYALLGPGMAMGFTGTGFWGGFEFPLGAGGWGRVWRGLFLGGELGVDMMRFADQPGDPYEAGMFNFEVKFLLGWHTGWQKRKE